MLFKKLILSVFIGFHVFLVALLPSGQTYAVRHLPGWMFQYSNFIGFNTTWNFFSPEPAHKNYFEFVIYFDDEELEPVREYLPPEREEIVTKSSHRRMLYAAHLISAGSTWVFDSLLPGLCIKYRGADRIEVVQYLHELVSLDSARVHIGTPVEDLKTIHRNLIHQFNCPQNNEIHSDSEGNSQ